MALWLLHTYCFNRFTITPRLALISPVNGCGKTTLLAVMEKLAYRPQRMDHTTPAVIFQTIHRTPGTLLVDEADNLGLNVNGILRAIFNSGHRQGGNVRRYMGGAPGPTTPMRRWSLPPLAIYPAAANATCDHRAHGEEHSWQHQAL